MKAAKPTEKPATVDEYFAALPPGRREALGALRELVGKCLPRARETMHYKMPTWELDGPVCAIASQKQHLALYLCDVPVLDDFRDELSHLNLGKGCVRFRSLDELPKMTVRAMLREAARRS